jgi:hypothetical protein
MNTAENTRLIDDLATSWGNPQKAQRALSEIFLPQANDPNNSHDREYYQDLAEITSEHFRDWDDPLYYKIVIAGREYDCSTPEEISFLGWIRQLMKRGLEFEAAFLKAKDIMRQDPQLANIVYELDESDRYDLEEWTERLADNGIPQDKIGAMAENIVCTLRQQYLAMDQDWFDEDEKQKSKELLERLRDPRIQESLEA